MGSSCDSHCSSSGVMCCTRSVYRRVLASAAPKHETRHGACISACDFPTLYSCTVLHLRGHRRGGIPQSGGIGERRCRSHVTGRHKVSRDVARRSRKIAIMSQECREMSQKCRDVVACRVAQRKIVSSQCEKTRPPKTTPRPVGPHPPPPRRGASPKAFEPGPCN